MKQFVNIFDLDCTLIDSSHRVNADGDASKGLDLDFWVTHSTEEFISKDKLMPLVDLFREFKKTNFTNIAVTARDMNEADFKFLKDNGLDFDMVLHRGDSKELDHVLKAQKLDTLFKETDLKPFIAVDDKKENLEIFKKYGFICIDANEMNEKIGGTKINCSTN